MVKLTLTREYVDKNDEWWVSRVNHKLLHTHKCGNHVSHLQENVYKSPHISISP